MRIILPAVMSADGRITKGDIGQAHYWSSKEDADFFAGLVKKHTALVMGRKTYEVVQPSPTPDKLRLVLTSKPEQFAQATIPGSLEFMSASPREIVDYLEKQGHAEMLLVGGAPVHAAFLQAGLVDELYLTIEPVLFGKGLPLVEGSLEVDLELQQVTRLNTRGTLLLHYIVTK